MTPQQDWPGTPVNQQPQQPAPQPTQQGQQFPGVIQGRPAPVDPVQERNFETGRGDERFDRLTTYRNEFFNSPAVRDFEEVRIQARQIEGLADREGSAMGDLGLVFSFMKTLDPGSTVREGEFATASNAAGVPERIVVAYNRLLSGEGLSEDQRQDMAQTAAELVRARAQSYNATVDRYARLIEAEGGDPALQGIERYGRPFGGVEVTRRPPPSMRPQTGQAPTGQTPDGQAPDEQPNAAAMYPNGVELQMDTWGRDNPFDRNRALVEYFGLESATDEDRIIGYWNSQRNNANLSVDDARGWYQQQGLPVPTDEDLRESVEQARAGTTFQGFDMRDLEANRREILDNEIGNRGGNPESPAWSGVNAVTQGATFEMGDEIAAGIAAIPSTFSEGGFVDAYRNERDLNRRYGERADEANPGIALAGRLGGGLMTGGVTVGRSAPQAARSAYRITREAGNAPAVARAAANQAARRSVVGEGAVLGGIAGFGAGEGAANSLAGAGLGAAAGGVVGGALQAGTNALAPVVSRATQPIRNAISGNRAPKPTRQQADEVIGAGDRMGVPVRRADVDPNVRARRGQVLQTERGAPLRQAETDDLQAMETALVRNLGGGTTDRVSGGDAIQSGIRGARERIRNEASNNYQAARSQSNDVRVQPTRAIEAIDTEIAELTRLGANRNKAQIGYLRELREDLASEDGLGIDVIRAQRTGLRQELNNRSLYSNDFERRIGGILDAAGEDIAEGLADNPQALARYQRGDELWRQQAEFGEQIGDVLLGRNAGNPRAPADTAATVMGWAQKDPARLTRMMDEAGPEVADEVRAMIANELGRSTNSNFSLGRFLTQTSEGSGNRLSPQATRALFGEDGARAIADLRVLARAKTDAAEMTNRSNTGNVVNRAVNGFRTMMLGGMGIAEGGATGGAIAAASGSIITRLGEGRSLRLLLNPNFTRWLRSLPDSSNPRAIDGAFDRLRRVAERTPGMSADVQALERALVDAANDNAVGAGRAVAEEEPQAN